MRPIIFLLLVFTSVPAISQKTQFVRVFDLSGKKIHRGQVLAVTDSTLQLKNDSTIIPFRSIGYIKTKRSGGHNVLIGSVIGGVTSAIFGAAVADPDTILGWTVGEGILLGLFLGAPNGAGFGAITTLFKNPQTYIIDGDINKWAAVKGLIATGITTTKP